jgi:hypothetical protein
MISKNGKPSLLVEVMDFDNQNNFNFYVVNGAWYGVYTNGYVTTIGAPGGDWTSLDKCEISCQDQYRLRGDYNDVFDNFHDVNYIAPKPKNINFSDMNDDIPF